jgi:hypothetical protein
MEEKKIKYTTYLTREAVKALKRFAVEKEINDYEVIEAALRRAIPEKYWQPYTPREGGFFYASATGTISLLGIRGTLQEPGWPC